MSEDKVEIVKEIGSARDLEIKRTYQEGFRAGKIEMIRQIEDMYAKGQYTITIKAINPCIINKIKDELLDVPGAHTVFFKVGGKDAG